MERYVHKDMISRYNALMDNTWEMLIFFDSHGRITECNTQAVRELEYGDDIYGLSVAQIFCNAFTYQDKQILVNDRYQNTTAEAVAYRKNQTCFPVELKVICLKENNACYGLCLALNISGKKDAERKIKSLKDEIGAYNEQNARFMANVTHELRTPINGIEGFVNNLLNTELNPEQQEAANIIKRCCANMNMIINDFLDNAKLAYGKFKLEIREFNFHNMIRQIIDFNKNRIYEKGLNLLVDISDGIPEFLVGDELRLTQILNNLFSNAIKFTSVGHIGLEISKVFESEDNIELLFMIFDTGIGISKNDRDKLFKSFSQVDNSISRRFGGSGLGLSISKKLVEAMGGTITVDSEENKGSIFSFSVRLQIPHERDYDRESCNLLQGDMGEDGYAGNEAREILTISELDFINKKLQESGHTIQKKNVSMEDMMKAIGNMAYMLEKLAICIKMESWETAEELAFELKALIPKDHIEHSRTALRLLLEIRKENPETALALVSHLEELIRKENH